MCNVKVMMVIYDLLIDENRSYLRKPGKGRVIACKDGTFRMIDDIDDPRKVYGVMAESYTCSSCYVLIPLSIPDSGEIRYEEAEKYCESFKLGSKTAEIPTRSDMDLIVSIIEECDYSVSVSTNVGGIMGVVAKCLGIKDEKASNIKKILDIEWTYKDSKVGAWIKSREYPEDSSDPFKAYFYRVKSKGVLCSTSRLGHHKVIPVFKFHENDFV